MVQGVCSVWLVLELAVAVAAWRRGGVAVGLLAVLVPGRDFEAAFSGVER